MNDSIVNKLRSDAIIFFKEGIKAATPQNVIPANVFLDEDVFSITDLKGNNKSFDLKDYNRIIVIGAGKASTAMAKEIEMILANRIFEGLVVTKYNFVNELKNVKIIEAAHPLPDSNGLKAVRAVINNGCGSLLAQPQKRGDPRKSVW